jgi:Raf kinase inhibitor-like YbhB/YbcL family protein
MKVTSQSLKDKGTIPPQYALGVPGAGGPVPGPNKSPHLAWSDAPAGTKSFAVIAVDVAAPAKADDANKSDRTIPYDFPRADFYHWALIDIHPSLTELPEGADSDGLTVKGKPPGKTPNGVRGVNSYREWFGDDPNMGGDYGGYDGPWPPFNDERAHRYVFTVYALDVATLGLTSPFSCLDAVKALEKHVLGKASIEGTYSLNPTAKP